MTNTICPESTLPAAGSEVGEPERVCCNGMFPTDEMCCGKDLVERKHYDSLRAQLAAVINERDEWMEASEKLAIRATTAESALSAQRREWIPVGERLPGFNVTVWSLLEGDHVSEMEKRWHDGKVWRYLDGSESNIAVIHWMPLPASPQTTDTPK